MIRWLVGSALEDADLARGVPPPGVLSQWEDARWTSLRSEKRRRDWLLGRWTAKRLLQTALASEIGIWLPLDVLVIDADRDGAPRVSLPAVPLQAIGLSISHSHDRAFCALAPLAARPSSSKRAADVHVGADIERIERRPWEFMEDYFTAQEIAHVEAATAGAVDGCQATRDLLITAIWSAKEAVLKALRLGLTVDTRAVSCTIELPFDCRRGATAEQIQRAASRHWHPLMVHDAPDAGQRWHLNGYAHSWYGWWRTLDGCVLTLAVLG